MTNKKTGECGDVLDQVNGELSWVSPNEDPTFGLIRHNPSHSNIDFQVGGRGDFPLIKILELKHNGDIVVKGKVIEDEKELCHALREFLYYWAGRK